MARIFTRIPESVYVVVAKDVERKTSEKQAQNERRCMTAIKTLERMLDIYEKEVDRWTTKLALAGQTPVVKKSILVDIIYLHYKMKKVAQSIAPNYAYIGDIERAETYRAYSRTMDKLIEEYENKLPNIRGLTLLRR